MATTNYLDALTRLAPALEAARVETTAAWAPDDPPATILFAALGNAVAVALPFLAPEDREILLALIDEGVGAADEELSAAVATGLVEGAVARADGSGRLDELLAALGPAARAHAEAWSGRSAPHDAAARDGGGPPSDPPADTSRYVALLQLPLDDGGRLVAFDSFPHPDVFHREIAGREVFRFDASNRRMWQIAPEPGTTGGRTHAFDRSKATDESFVNVFEANGDLYASRINGDTFLIDMMTGAATYSGFART